MNTTDDNTNGTEIRKLRRPGSAERERVLAEWAASGRRIEEIAATTGWSRHTLYRWRQLARKGKRVKKAAIPALLAVPRPAEPSGRWAAEVTIGSTMTVRLAAGCAPAWAGQLVRELKPC